MTKLLYVLSSLALLMAVFIPLERAFAARREQRVLRRDWVVDLCFFGGQYFVFAALATAWLWQVSDAVGSVTPLGDLQRRTAELPLWVQGPLALLLGDLAVYWFHRACHHYAFLWRFHAVHHSTEQLDWLAAHREHPLDGLATQTAINLPALLIGISPAALGPLIILRGMWAIFIHSNVDINVGPLRYLLGEPSLHRWHHAKLETKHNFANLAPYLDLLFGTYHRPERLDFELGLTEAWPRGYLAQLTEPFRPRSVVRLDAAAEPPSLEAPAPASVQP